MIFKTLRHAVLAAFLVLSFFTTANAATIVVNTLEDAMADDGFCSVREAFASANQDTSFDVCTAGSGDDVIELPQGVITLDFCLPRAQEEGTEKLSYSPNECGDLVLTNNAIVNGHENGTIIRGAHDDRIIRIYRNALIDAQLGEAVTEEVDLECETPLTVTFNDFTVERGRAWEGGGIANYSANLTLNNMIVQKNTTLFSGGGIYSQFDLTVNNSSVSNNYFDHPDNLLGGGGGIRIVSVCSSDVDTSRDFENPVFSKLIVNNSVVDNNCLLDPESEPEDSGGSYDEYRFNCYGGGGISASTTSVEIINGSSVSGNIAVTQGGGVSVFGGSLLVEDSKIDKNEAIGDEHNLGRAGGIRFQGFTYVDEDRNSYCLEGEFLAVLPASEGGLPVRTLTIKNSSVSGNKVNGSAGGILAYEGSLSITDSTIDSNSAGTHTGGVYFIGFFDHCIKEVVGEFDLISSTVSNNEAKLTGGITNDTGFFTCTNSTISSNTAAYGRGGGYYQIAHPSEYDDIPAATEESSDNTEINELFGHLEFGAFNNCTVTRNRVDTLATDCRKYSFTRGGGVYIDSGKATSINTIFAENFDDERCELKDTPTNFAPDIYTPDCSFLDEVEGLSAIFDGFSCVREITPEFISNGYNFIGDSSGLIFTPAEGDQVGTTGNSLNPFLGPLRDSGGATMTHEPLVGSPLIDRGSGNSAASSLRASGNGCQAVDQRGTTRPIDGNLDGAAVCDIGAVEVQFDFGCFDTPLAATQFQMDGGVKLLSETANKAVRMLRRAGGRKAQLQRYLAESAQLYLEGWEATWVRLPSNTLQCLGQHAVGNLCVSASTEEAGTAYLASSEALRDLVAKITKRTRKLGGKKGRKLNRRAGRQHNNNTASADALPSTTLVCS